MSSNGLTPEAPATPDRPPTRLWRAEAASFLQNGTNTRILPRLGLGMCHFRKQHQTLQFSAYSGSTITSVDVQLRKQAWHFTLLWLCRVPLAGSFRRAGHAELGDDASYGPRATSTGWHRECAACWPHGRISVPRGDWAKEPRGARARSRV